MSAPEFYTLLFKIAVSKHHQIIAKDLSWVLKDCAPALWYFQKGPVPNHDDAEEITLIIQGSAIEAEQIRARLIARSPGFYSDSAPIVHPTEHHEFHERSQGGPKGIALYRRFQAADSRFVIDVTRELVQEPSAADQVVIATVIFLAQCLGLTSQQLLEWIPKWLEALGNLTPDPESYPVIRAEARKLRSENPKLQSLIEGCLSSNKATENHVFKAHRPAFESIGSDFPIIAKTLPERRPPVFVLLHSYLHTHFLRMGMGNYRETLILEMIHASL
jgi:hypothetical protein